MEPIKLEFQSDFFKAWIASGSVTGLPDQPRYDATLSYAGDLEKLQEVAALEPKLTGGRPDRGLRQEPHDRGGG